jgi:hypothetical protein
MTKQITTALLGVALGACLLASPAAACPGGEMKMANGECFPQPGLAASMRERAVLMNQLKIGYNLPIAPKKDNLYPRNFDVSRFEFSQAGNYSTIPFPPSP